MLAVASLIREAKSSIVLIDAYVGERTLDLLTMRDPGVTVQVLTSDESIKPAFVAHGKAFVRSAALWKFAQARRFTIVSSSSTTPHARSRQRSSQTGTRRLW